MTSKEPGHDLAAALRAIGMDREIVATAVRAAIAVRNAASRRSPATVEKYAKAYARMRTGQSMPAQATNKKTFHFRRAAWNAGVASDLGNALRDLAEIRSQGRRSEEAAAMEKVRTLVRDMIRFPEDLKREHLALWRRGELVGDFEQLHPGEQTHRASKRAGLRALPDDWRNRLVRAADDAGSIFAIAIAVICLTGCRPVEVALGVELILEGGELRVRIRGAKYVPGLSGQAWRELIFPAPASCPGGRAILKWMAAASGVGSTTSTGQSVMVQVTSRQALCNAVRDFGRSLSVPGVHDISCLSLRHAFSSDLKAAGYAPAEIAAALGHAVDKTCTMYGMCVHGRGGLSIRVRTSGPVKPTRQAPPAARRKAPKRRNAP